MTTFVALYRGQTVGEAKLLAVSADPRLVFDVATRLLSCPEQADQVDDPALTRLAPGRRAALRVIEQEASDGRDS